MRSERDVDAYRSRFLANGSLGDKLEYCVACYEACIPRMMWEVSSSNVTNNLDVFNQVILKYTAAWRRVRKNGYSLLLVGDNGCGKTTFASFILTQMIKRGASAYYTTLMGMDSDIKRGFNDHEAAVRLDAMLSSDFLAIDELGKEHFKTDSYLCSVLEMILKRRYDDGDPTILVSNVDHQRLVDMYGPSVESMLDGKYMTCQLEPGDFRKHIRDRMRAEIGL